jgi:hypothetical protein
MSDSKPKIIVAPSFRKIDEIFDSETLQRLGNLGEIVWGQDGPMPQNDFEGRGLYDGDR